MSKNVINWGRLRVEWDRTTSIWGFWPNSVFYWLDLGHLTIEWRR